MIVVALAAAVLFIAAFLVTISRIDSATGTWPLGLVVNIGWPAGLLAFVLGFVSWVPDVVGIVALSISAAISLIAIIGVVTTDGPSLSEDIDTEQKEK